MSAPVAARQFPCPTCGADVTWDPAAESHRCANCNAEVPPPTRGASLVPELDFVRWSDAVKRESGVELHQQLTVKCGGCGAETAFGDNVAAGRCAFCGSAISAQRESKRLIKPGALLPFKLTQPQALDLFGKWVRSRWFAPNAFHRLARPDAERLRGVYLPFWTYDAHALTQYTGERGDDYYTTEHYTTTENGQTVTRTRQVKHTRWTNVSGAVENSFDDVLVCATGSVPGEIVTKLEPWDLESLSAYADEYVAGFESEVYSVDLTEGFGRAREIMNVAIRETICADIGGDHQQISSAHSNYDDVTFKHLLLPLWLCSYRFRKKVYRVVVNARTGEVQGERPWSWIKITSLVLVIAALIATAVYFWQSR